jgi:GYF domain 2
MSEQTSNSPPPIPSTDRPPETNVKPTEWHYVANGVKKGPVSSTKIRDLLNKKEIETDIQVWRKGMIEWKSIRESDLAELVASEPPAISPQHIGNGYVWTLAFMPLIFGVIDAAVAASNHEAAARSLVLGFPYHPSKGLPVQIPFLLSAMLGWLDDRRLKQAGYGSWVTRVTAVFLQPVYLFMRAKRLKQRPYYAIAWILSLVIGFLIYASVDG